MEEMIKWLIELEKAAQDLYYNSGQTYFVKNEKLSKFLLLMSEDESYHFNVMNSAGVFISENKFETKPGIILDEALKNKILHPFNICFKKLEEKTLIEEDMYNCLLTGELSEWNDIFIYVVNLLANQKKEFQFASSNMQKHLLKLEYFFNSDENLKKYYKELIKIPKIWTNKILIIDDEKAIRDLLISTFKKNYYYVDEAVNGEEGFNKIQHNYYDVIISDVDMPVMDGLEMLNKITKNNLLFDKETLIFISGSLKNSVYFEMNKLKFIQKPFLLETIKEEVTKIINRYDFD
jgi:CheY-like chemotaxis protein